MKKIFTLIAAAAMLAVSCQNEITPEKVDSSNPVEGKLTATIVKTKVSYAETSEMNLQPAWEVGDKIIGFDDAGNTYTLTVASVSAETATLSGSVPDGALHLIYKSGAKASDISAKSLAIDYTNQAGDKTMPAVMLADGTVEDGSCHFSFINAGAIIGISAVNGIPSGSNISKITVEGENLSAAIVALSGSALALIATTAASDAISTATLSGITTTDANGTLSAPVFVAVPAGAVITKVCASVSDMTYSYTLAAARTTNASDYLYVKAQEFADPYNGHAYVEMGGLKWATMNVGANSPKEYGWYFSWAGTTGYVHNGSKWVKASDSNAELSGGFNWVNTRYQTQNTTAASSSRFTKYIGVTYKFNSYKDPSATDADASKTDLDPEDDAASVNWGGTWRTPSSAEFQALYEACGGTGSYVTPIELSSANPGKGIYWVSAGQTYISEYTGTAGTLFCDGTSMLFFPAAGTGMDNNFYSAGSYGEYWSATVCSSCPYLTYYFSFYIVAAYNQAGSTSRCYGLTVRPVSDAN